MTKSTSKPKSYVVEVSHYFMTDKRETSYLKSRRYYRFDDASKAIKFMHRAERIEEATYCRIFEDITGKFEQQQMDF